nr:protein RALF-like 34 [Ipomoea batatas]
MSLYGGGDAEEEEELEGEESPAAGSRRSLFWHTMRYYISYGALSANRIPCPPRSGRSYYTHNCHVATGPVRPYFRGCSAITRCRSPTFSAAVHSNSHIKVLEMTRQKTGGKNGIPSNEACGYRVDCGYGEKAQSKKGGCGLWPVALWGRQKRFEEGESRTQVKTVHWPAGPAGPDQVAPTGHQENQDRCISRGVMAMVFDLSWGTGGGGSKHLNRSLALL